MEEPVQNLNYSDPKEHELERHTSKHKWIVGPVKNFNQKYTMFNRPRWDPKVMDWAGGIYGVIPPKEKDGHSLIDRALQNTGWYLEMAFAHGHIVHGQDLYSWEKQPFSDCLRIPKGKKLVDYDIHEMSRRVKKVAKVLGADLVGICQLDNRWVYSTWFNLHSREEGHLELPEGCKYAIAIAVEMDYDMFKTSPNEVEGAATGLGYSKMAFVAGSLAHFIRDLGYTAIASGNDTALSIPIAIDAGLGELGRNGLLMTPNFGPRVRISKVITDLPLIPDDPIEVGAATFCETCKKCADECPNNAITKGERTDQALNESTSPGVLKWPVNGEKCFQFWSKNNTCCGNCIRVCPFNKPDTAFHRVARWHVKNLPQFNRIYKWLDDACGYGKHLKAEEWWNDDENV
ncbi:MAG: reductive dehalogenase [Desulfobacteraceae bacterium]|jgi:reductive dehalogenase